MNGAGNNSSWASGGEPTSALGSEMIRFSDQAMDLEQTISDLFVQLRDPVYRYVCVILHTPAVAEEITQETFMKLCRELRGGKSFTNVRGWLFRVAHNLAVDFQAQPNRVENADQQTWEEVRECYCDSGRNPEERVLEVERAQRVHLAMGRLSPRERECMHLRAEGFRYREIADILNISDSSVDEFLRRAMRKLMRELNV